MDQLDSLIQGFVAQLKGHITKNRHCVSYVLIDHYSRLIYIYLQGKLVSEERLSEKKDFEEFIIKRGVIIRRYNDGNIIISDNAFIHSLKYSKYKISYCGVKTHFQNSI